MKTNSFEILRVFGDVEDGEAEEPMQMHPENEEEEMQIERKEEEEESDEEKESRPLKSFQLIFQDDFVPFCEGELSTENATEIDVSLEVLRENKKSKNEKITIFYSQETDNQNDLEGREILELSEIVVISYFFSEIFL